MTKQLHRLAKHANELSKLVFAGCLILGATLLNAQTAIPVSNGDFELPGDVKHSVWSEVPGWSTDGPNVDSGVEPNGGAGSGGWTGFLHNKDASAFNLTGHVIASGENYRLTLDAWDIYYGLDNFQVTLYYDTGDGTRNVLATDTFNAASGLELLASATGPSIGANLGIELDAQAGGNPGWENNGWTGIDNVALTYSTFSSNANLSNISLSGGGTLSPTFASSKIKYTGFLPAGTTSVTPTVTKSDTNASVSGDGPVDVTSGYGMSQIVVTAEDGVSQKTYTVYYVVYDATTMNHSYTFDVDATDSTGSADGVLNGATIVGGKAILDTDGDFVSLDAAAIGINAYNSVTVEAYITASNVVFGGNGNTTVFYFGNNDPSNDWKGYDYLYAQGTVGNGNSRAAISTTGILDGDPWVDENGISGPALNDAALHHVVLTGTQTALTFYVDGASQGTVSFTGTNALSALGTELAWLGKNGYQYDPTWQGEIDAYYIYSGVMDPATVASRANSYVLGVNDFNIKNAYKLYPNPSNGGDFSIKLDNSKFGSSVNVKVYDILGKMVLNNDFDTKSNTIEVKQNLKSGLYLVRLDNVATTRLIVK